MKMYGGVDVETQVFSSALVGGDLSLISSFDRCYQVKYHAIIPKKFLISYVTLRIVILQIS
jgi:hypothetical protein